ncbi:dihydrolipoyl dehydrogenase [Desulfopila inferna]|uniref:dihydrolipoyl dehydrogenase n=1 Tax=Desulfopila inferna TaxID=468528 RepID=UPI001963865F|nr:dihydrolipoyl dehydrogenase [Desulfopila inferna]
MSESKKFDLVVLGGGPGGYTAAFRGADLGLSVCLIEKGNRLGGVCLNVGCIPSKTLLHGALVIEEAQEAADFGITFNKPEIDLEAMRAKKESVIKKLTDGLDGLVKARKITRITGNGVFQDQESLKVTTAEGDSVIGFKNAIIATGSRPFALPGQPEDSRIWDSSDALRLDFIPGRLLIIGGGVIGLEMAQVYSALGSEITIVEMLDQLIPPADKDMVQPLFQKLKKIYTIMTNAKVTKITAEENAVKVVIEHKEKEETSEYDAVLIAVGRKPNSEEIGLDKLGITTSSRGYIEVDEQQRTSAATVFAIGDVVGDPMLAHKATHQGKVAAEVCAGHNSAFSALAIPAVAYTNPEVAWMGFTEKEAKEKGIEYDKGKFSWGASGRALSSGAAIGASKVLFSKETGRIIGAAICGLNGGELIHEAVVALELGADAEDISKTIHAHPTLSETFAFACEMVDGSITDALPPKKKK